VRCGGDPGRADRTVGCDGNVAPFGGCLSARLFPERRRLIDWGQGRPTGQGFVIAALTASFAALLAAGGYCTAREWRKDLGFEQEGSFVLLVFLVGVLSRLFSPEFGS
jgi:hypothetical protein